MRVYADHHCRHHRLPFPVSLQVTAAGMPYFGSASHLFRATPRQDPTGWHLVNKPDRDCGRQAVREPAHRTSERYDLGRNAYSESAIRRLAFALRSQ